MKNWRPISVLNLDYKFATKALALRLKKVLPQVISNAQTGYIEGRFIGQNIRYSYFTDFEKAFNSLKWNFILETTKTFSLARTSGNGFK